MKKDYMVKVKYMPYFECDLKKINFINWKSIYY
jgi:hypothetical protein